MPASDFGCEPPTLPPVNERLQFGGEAIAMEANMAVSGFGAVGAPAAAQRVNGHADACGNVLRKMSR